MKKLLFGALALVLFAGAGCKKDKAADPVCELSSTTIQGNYKLTAVTLQVASLPEADVYNDFYDACDKDDIYGFGANSVFTLTDSGIQCSPSNSHVSTWSLTGNLLNVTDEDISGTVTFFSCNMFVVSQVDATNTYKYYPILI